MGSEMCIRDRTIHDFPGPLVHLHHINPADPTQRFPQSVALSAGMATGVEFVGEELSRIDIRLIPKDPVFPRCREFLSGHWLRCYPSAH
mgnify:CR=1 FL=1